MSADINELAELRSRAFEEDARAAQHRANAQTIEAHIARLSGDLEGYRSRNATRAECQHLASDYWRMAREARERANSEEAA